MLAAPALDCRRKIATAVPSCWACSSIARAAAVASSSASAVQPSASAATSYCCIFAHSRGACAAYAQNSRRAGVAIVEYNAAGSAGGRGSGLCSDNKVPAVSWRTCMAGWCLSGASTATSGDENSTRQITGSGADV